MIVIFRNILDEFGLITALVYGVIYGDIKERMTGVCLLGADGVAVVAGLHERTVRTHLRRLWRAGWLERSSHLHYYKLTDKAPKLTATRLAKLLDPIGDVCYNKNVTYSVEG